MPVNPDIDAWFMDKQHPLEEEMQMVRSIILGVDDRITETIKWSTPTFMFEGNIASFNPAKRFVSLLFHTGAKIPGDHPRLEGDGDTARVMRFGDKDEIRDAQPDLEQLIGDWIAWKSSG